MPYLTLFVFFCMVPIFFLSRSGFSYLGINSMCLIITYYIIASIYSNFIEANLAIFNYFIIVYLISVFLGTSRVAHTIFVTTIFSASGLFFLYEISFIQIFISIVTPLTVYYLVAVILKRYISNLEQDRHKQEIESSAKVIKEQQLIIEQFKSQLTEVEDLSQIIDNLINDRESTHDIN